MDPEAMMRGGSFLSSTIIPSLLRMYLSKKSLSALRENDTREAPEITNVQKVQELRTAKITVRAAELSGSLSDASETSVLCPWHVALAP